MKPQHLHALLVIADHGADKEIRLTTPEYAKQLGLSQQSASRLLLELQNLGYITRSVSRQGQIVTFTPKGKEELTRLRSRINAAFTNKPKTLSGKVKDGLGEGAYYMKLDGYRKQFERKLGYAPYPGTLNLVVSADTGKQVHEDPTFFSLDGFQAEGRTFGGLRTKRCIIKANGNEVEGAIIIPDRTSHTAETIELVSPTNLREELDIDDEEEIEIVY